jgi:hypothetical protein
MCYLANNYYTKPAQHQRTYQSAHQPIAPFLGMAKVWEMMNRKKYVEKIFPIYK